MIEGITFSPSPVLYIIAGFIVGLFGGWVIGFFDSNNRAAKKIAAAEKEAEARIRKAEEKSRKAEAQAASAPHSDTPALLRLKNEGGRYILEMDGAPLTGILSAEKKKRLINLLTIIRPYLESGQPASTPATATPPRTPPTPVVRPEPAFSPVNPLQPTLRAMLFPEEKPEEKPFTSLSIVAQIDSVLQARLAESPLAGRGIRLHESPQGAVEVYVGLQKYSSVDEVPDESIRAAIRAAIAEWEEKYTPRG